eukprot:2897092-Pleurochrysis_carterae.AAC.1
MDDSPPRTTAMAAARISDMPLPPPAPEPQAAPVEPKGCACRARKEVSCVVKLYQKPDAGKVKQAARAVLAGKYNCSRAAAEAFAISNHTNVQHYVQTWRENGVGEAISQMDAEERASEAVQPASDLLQVVPANGLQTGRAPLASQPHC